MPPAPPLPLPTVEGAGVLLRPFREADVDAVGLLRSWKAVGDERRDMLMHGLTRQRWKGLSAPDRIA